MVWGVYTDESSPGREGKQQMLGNQMCKLPTTKFEKKTHKMILMMT